MESKYPRLFFFLQAEDGIREADVTGVQTCALPIWDRPLEADVEVGERLVAVEGVSGRPHVAKGQPDPGCHPDSRPDHQDQQQRAGPHRPDIVERLAEQDHAGSSATTRPCSSRTMR